MKTQTLKEIKDQLGKFYELVHKVALHWNNCFPYYMTIAVLLQNMAFDRCHSYEEQEEELFRIKDILYSFSRHYEDNHFVQWVYGEVDMIISGNVMSEEEDEIHKQEEQI